MSIKLLTQTFDSPRSPREAPLVKQLNQFFSQNPAIGLVSVSVGRFDGPSHSGGVQLRVSVAFGSLGIDNKTPTLTTKGGAPYYVVEFIDLPGNPADTQSDAFFAANPDYFVVRTLLIQPTEPRYAKRTRLIVFYQSFDFYSQSVANVLSVAECPTTTVGPTRLEAGDATDLTRERLHDVANLTSTPWYNAGRALVLRHIDNVGTVKSAVAAPVHFAPPPAPVFPAPAAPPTAPPPCPCCYRMTSFDTFDGITFLCTHTPHLTLDFKSCRSGELIDIAKAAVKGFVNCTCPNTPPCGDLLFPPGKDWPWPDPDHFLFEATANIGNGFVVVAALEDMIPFCADFDYNDRYYVMFFERCDGVNSCPEAPANPPTPGVDPSIPVTVL